MLTLKYISKGFKIYGAKDKNFGHNILNFTKGNEEKKKQRCLYENISWFGDLEQAQHYKTNKTDIFIWKTKKNVELLKINQKNESILKNLFLNTKITLHPTIKIPKKMDSFLKIEHPFLKMNENEKAYFEFAFAFGYISVEEQNKFMEFLFYLIKENVIDLNMRSGVSIVNKLYSKIKYYNYYPFSKQQKYNRLSFYEIDKYALVNLCLILNNTNKYKHIEGVYQPNNSSFWFPDLVIYKMNIQEYILFSPHTSLEYEGKIE